uniref:Uncharacterized protein n=1 Tax=Toxoplasma gondii COUG TaxID=1074873 RepID=A0A2G8YD81_TOXGO|nr:hypothetical protein TGCOUG_259970 [Toxoplasma gondii COUG]
MTTELFVRLHALRFLGVSTFSHFPAFSCFCRHISFLRERVPVYDPLHMRRMWPPTGFDRQGPQSPGGLGASDLPEGAFSRSLFSTPRALENSSTRSSLSEKEVPSESCEKTAKASLPGLRMEETQRASGNVFRPFRSQHHWRSSPSFTSFGSSQDLSSSPLYRFSNVSSNPQFFSSRTLGTTSCETRRRLSVPEDSLSGGSVPLISCDSKTSVVLSPLCLPSLAGYPPGVCTPRSPKGGESSTRQSISSVSTDAFSLKSITPRNSASSFWTDSGCLTPFGSVSPGALSRPLGHPPSTGSYEKSAKSLSACRSCPASVFAAYATEAESLGADDDLEQPEEESSETDDGESALRRPVSQSGVSGPTGRVRDSRLCVDVSPARSVFFVPSYLREKACKRECVLTCVPALSPLKGITLPRLGESSRCAFWAIPMNGDAEERQRKAGRSEEGGLSSGGIPANAGDNKKGTDLPAGSLASRGSEDAHSRPVATERQGPALSGDAWTGALRQPAHAGHTGTRTTSDGSGRRDSCDLSISTDMSQTEEKAASRIARRAGGDVSAADFPARQSNGALPQEVDKIDWSAEMETRQGSNGIWASFQLICKVKTIEKASLVLP